MGLPAEKRIFQKDAFPRKKAFSGRKMHFPGEKCGSREGTSQKKRRKVQEGFGVQQLRTLAKLSQEKRPFGQPFLLTTPSPLLWRALKKFFQVLLQHCQLTGVTILPVVYRSWSAEGPRHAKCPEECSGSAVVRALRCARYQESPRQTEKFMNFAHFCEFWCFSFRKTSTIHIELLFRNVPAKSSWTDLSLVWFAEATPDDIQAREALRSQGIWAERPPQIESLSSMS